MAHRSVEEWLDAAERSRVRARRASERAAQAEDPRLALRLEREASLHLSAASSFEFAAVATFRTQQLELQLTRAVVRALS